MPKLLPLTGPQLCSLLALHRHGTGAGAEADGRCSGASCGLKPVREFRASEDTGPVATRNAPGRAVGRGSLSPFSREARPCPAGHPEVSSFQGIGKRVNCLTHPLGENSAACRQSGFAREGGVPHASRPACGLREGVWSLFQEFVLFQGLGQSGGNNVAFSDSGH